MMGGVSGMKNRRDNKTAVIATIGGIILAIILVGGTMLMGRLARKDAVDAVRNVSLLYLDELAGRREQVVEDNLKDNINVIDISRAISIILMLLILPWI